MTLRGAKMTFASVLLLSLSCQSELMSMSAGFRAELLTQRQRTVDLIAEPTAEEMKQTMLIIQKCNK